MRFFTAGRWRCINTAKPSACPSSANLIRVLSSAIASAGVIGTVVSLNGKMQKIKWLFDAQADCCQPEGLPFGSSLVRICSFSLGDALLTRRDAEIRKRLNHGAPGRGSLYLYTEGRRGCEQTLAPLPPIPVGTRVLLKWA